MPRLFAAEAHQALHAADEQIDGGCDCEEKKQNLHRETGKGIGIVFCFADDLVQVGQDLPEAGFFQRSDGAVFLFSRTDGGTMICAASADEGRTWTDCYHTQITDHGAKFEFGTLPDGRYYYLGNADNKRSSVVLMISKDGINFNEWYILEDEPYAQMKEGMYKAGVYGYPTSYIDENYMYVIYSLRKESVEVLRVPLSSIGVK